MIWVCPSMTPPQSVGHLWLLCKLYPLVSPLFQGTCLCHAETLIEAWWAAWHLVYQFNHGLKACLSIRIGDHPANISAEDLASHPLWIPSSGSEVTAIPPNNAACLTITATDTMQASGIWLTSNLLLLPDGANLPVRFGVPLDASFSQDSFLLCLAKQHSEPITKHAPAWLTGPWCLSWFMAVATNPDAFALPIISWNQMWKTLEPLFEPDQSITLLAYTYPSLAWQGIACLDQDHLLHHMLPQLTAMVATRLRKYFEKCYTVLQNTPNLPAFPDSDHYLSYVLCPPSVHDWHRRLELPVFTTAMPSFPALHQYTVFPINQSCNYSSVTLSLIQVEDEADTAAATDASSTGPPIASVQATHPSDLLAHMTWGLPWTSPRPDPPAIA